MVEYFDHLQEKFVFDDQITECDLNSSDTVYSNYVNNLEMSINSDVDVDEHESDVDVVEDDSNIVTGDRDEFHTNNTLEEESEIDDEERFVSGFFICSYRLFTNQLHVFSYVNSIGLCIFEKLVTSTFL